ncbi:CusA/CzcA family heavy metal efflux RND transporter [Pedobacter cryotolerans]|uniref:CusA/CzcA family heavy metal efflux RND transporter n=1 Tax=Pedobacter cryotolerans TaxID=2571270 RepID=A0A4V5P0J5_9SPHI|nr:CusA/CzcA family heavy metal efflux RND transporter [Pedobacter cryotolerans]TKC01717.1 CusA/CzcA family heavy metal efflux RND transporter [Pedobacter cryotolerans]
MLNHIIGFAIKNKLIIGLFVLALVAYGSYQLTKLPIDAVPDITDNQVQVITIAPSFGATDIERLVTFPIEQANTNISGIKEIRSFSRFGLSLVTIVFDDDTDVYWARQQVAERLQKVQTEIPKGIGVPELGPITTGLGEIYQYVVRPKAGYENKYDETELRTIQDWIVRRQLLGVKGVAEISSFGGKLKQYAIELDPNKLLSFNLNINDVFKALENNNQNTGGAYIEKGATVLYIRSEGLVGDIADIENIAIKSLDGGSPLYIRDVAEVKIGAATRYGAMCFNDEGEVAGAIVMMLKGANSSQVITDVKDRIAQIQKTLPEGVVIEPFLDRSKMVNNAIGTVEKNLMEGALIVVFVLVVFLGNFRAGLLVASVIPLAMLFAVIMMNLFGVSGNLMSLGALDFGLIVDGAVIIVEAVMHFMHQSTKKELQHDLHTRKNVTKLTQNQMDEVVNKSAGKMMNSAVFGQIIILVVYLPIFTLEGIEGKMFKPMAQTVAFALLGAFILSLTYIPMMSALFLSKKTKHQPNISDRMMARLENYYHRSLSKILGFPKMVIAGTVSLFVIAMVVLSMMGGEFIPTLEEGDFAVETRVLTGSSLTTTIESTQKTAKVLLDKFPEVEKIVTKIGSGEVPTDPMPMEASDMMVILKDKSEWTSAKTFNELSEKMTIALQDVPGVTTGFQYPVQMRFNELMTGARQDVVLKIFGEDLDTLAHYANKLGQVINSVKGPKDLYVEQVAGLPQITINYNRNTLAQYNVDIATVNNIINMSLAGQTSGMVFEGEKRFDLVVRLNADAKKDVESIQNLLVPTPDGSQIPLSQLADVEIKDGPNQIQREDAKRRIIVGFNVGGRDVQSIVNDLKEQVDQKIKFPSGYYVTYGGAFENLNAAKQRLMIAVPVSLFLIFLLLFFAFKSVKYGLLIYSAIPLSAIGGILFLALRGMPFSISAGIGFIALFGVAVLNGIVLVAEFNRIKNEGETDLKRIVLEGTRLRLRPVLMTASVASLGFLPMALSNGAGAEVQRPLATVVIGGLLVATFLTLFVLPILYIIFERGVFKKLQINKAIVTIIALFVATTVGYKANAQTPITLQAAIDSALKNNLAVKSERLKADYQAQLIKSATHLPSTNISGEIGQFNSIYTDNKIGISQSFSFPSVYAKQKNLLTNEWKAAALNTSIKETELIKVVGETFVNLIYLKEKELLLMQSDTIFAEFLRKAELRLAKGESNILEKTTAEVQRGNIKMQLKQLLVEKRLIATQFHLLLNTKNAHEPVANQLPFITPLKTDSTLIANHPLLKFKAQQIAISKSLTAVEKAKLLPDVNLGVSSATIRGIGPDNVLYDGGKRFNSGQVGLSIPIFASAQRAKVKAAKILEVEALNNFEVEKQQIQNQYQSLVNAYQNHEENLAYLKKSALPNARLIAQIADKQFINGDINYLEWVMLTNQSIAILNNFIDAKKEFNEVAVQLFYLTSSK